MKRIFYLLIACLLFIGCSEKEEINEPIERDWQYLLLEQYGLLNTFDYEDTQNLSIIDNLNDSLICISGKLKSKDDLGLAIFNKKNNKKIVDIIPFKQYQYTIEKPYGEKGTLTLRQISNFNLMQYGDYIVLYIAVEAIEDNSNGSTLYEYLFIKDNKIINTTELEKRSCVYVGEEILQWKSSFIISLCPSNTYDGSQFLFSPNGELISKVYNGNRIKELHQDEIVTDDEYIYFNYTEYTGLYIARCNLLGHQIWLSEIKDTKKLDRPRFDNRKIVSKTDTHFTYELYYTEYNGNKGILKFKINIETGDIEYI